jgi:hypothetical protein
VDFVFIGVAEGRFAPGRESALQVPHVRASDPQLSGKDSRRAVWPLAPRFENSTRWKALALRGGSVF